MEEESKKMNLRGGFRNEESWRRNPGGQIMEEESWRRKQGEGIKEEESWRRNRRGIEGDHGKGIREQESWRNPGGRNQGGSIWEAFGRYLGDLEHLGASRGSGIIKVASLSNVTQKLHENVDFTICFWKVGVTKYRFLR